MKNKIVTCGLLGVLGIAIMLSSPALAGENEDQIAHARSAAPESVSAKATIVIDGEVVVEGSNGWTCMPEVFPGDRTAICVDATWAAMMGALGTKAAFTPEHVGISYMLAGDANGGGVSNSNPFHMDHQHAEDYVETGPHLMIIVPKALLGDISDDPATGGPWVMWGDTDYAHIMVPIQ